MAKKEKGLSKEESMKLAAILQKSTARMSGPRMIQNKKAGALKGKPASTLSF